MFVSVSDAASADVIVCSAAVVSIAAAFVPVSVSVSVNVSEMRASVISIIITSS